MRPVKYFLLALAAVATMSVCAHADFAQRLNYQGRLIDGNGVPLADGNYAVTYEICTDSACASVVWSEVHASVTVADGLLSDLLGATTALSAVSFDATEYWLRVSIGGTVYSPTQRIVAMPMALNIRDNAITSAKVLADSLTAADLAADSVEASELADNSVASANIINDSIVNADINSAAAIADTKLAQISTAGKVAESAITGTNWTDLTDGGTTALHVHAAATLTGVVHLGPTASDTDTTINSTIWTNKTGASGNLMELEVNAVNKFVVGYDGTVDSASIDSTSVVDDSLTTADLGVDSVAASELANDSVASANVIIDTLVAADIAADAIGASELADDSVASANIINDSIVNADINSAAAIADTKLAQISTAGKVAESAITGTNWTDLTDAGTTALHRHGAATIDGVVHLGYGTVDTDTSTNIGIWTNKTGVSGSLAELEVSGIDKFVVAYDGTINTASVDSVSVVDDSLTTSDLGVDSVAASELADNSVASANVIIDSLVAADIGDGLGLSEIDETVFQQRVTGTCTNNTSAMYSIAQGGTVSCTNKVTYAGTADDLVCTDCISDTEITDVYLYNTGDTITGDLVMGSAASTRLDFFDDVNEKVLLYGAAGVGTTYSLGVESSTMYFKANGNYRWYVAENADTGVSENMELDVDSLNFNSKEAITYSDTWLRLNNTAAFTSGVYTPGLSRADGGFDVDGNAVIDSAGTFFYSRVNSVNKFGSVNASGFGLDALNSGDWDLLIYEDGGYIENLRMGYGGTTAVLSAYDTNEALTINANGTGNLNLMSSGSGTMVAYRPIDLVRGDTSYVQRLGRMSFDWTTGTYNDSSFHGIESENEAGALADSIRINSYSDLIVTIDSNANSTSNFKVQKESTTNGTDLLTLNESGNLYVLGDFSAGSYTTLDARYLNASGGDAASGGTYTFTNNVANGNVVSFYGGADDTNYEWIGFYSGATRMGIFLWDGAWNECLANEFCMTGEGGPMALDSNGTIYMRDTVDVENNGIVDINWAASDDGSGSGLDADLLDGYHASTTRDAINTIPIRDANGYLQLGWINTTSGDNGTTGIGRVYASQDGYIRYYTPENFRVAMGNSLACTFHSFTAGGGTTYCAAGHVAVGAMDNSRYLRNPDFAIGGPTAGFLICCPAVTPFP